MKLGQCQQIQMLHMFFTWIKMHSFSIFHSKLTVFEIPTDFEKFTISVGMHVVVMNYGRWMHVCSTLYPRGLTC